MEDIIIIGAGIIGTSISRELSRYNAKIKVLERGTDVASGTTKANSGIVHAGFDAKPNTLKAKFNVEGNKMYEELSKELDFPYKKNGAFVLSFTSDLTGLNDLYDKGIKNGVENLSILTGDEVRKIEPHVSEKVQYALYAKDSGIVSPYEMAIAMAENATTNGVIYEFNKDVCSIQKENDIFVIKTKDNSTYECKVLINASGLNSANINNLLSNVKYKIVPRRGEYMILDKDQSYIAEKTLFQLPTEMGKGILVAPTCHSNILVGPTAKNIDDIYDTKTTYDGLNEAWNTALLSVEKLDKSSIITQFSGIRAHLDSDDFVIGFSSDVENLYNLVGIESPGLASSPAIAKYVSNEVSKHLNLTLKDNFISKRVGIKHVRDMNEKELEEAIKENPLYGHIVCRCEVVSEAEIIDAIRRNPGAKDLDGIKRRLRAGMGRCQMGFCTPKIMEILSKELNVPFESLTKRGNESFLVFGGSENEN